MIKFLEKSYIKTKKDLRICLHKNSSDKHHDMVILQQRKLLIFLINIKKKEKHTTSLKDQWLVYFLKIMERSKKFIN